jgi:hypothetical protein
METVPICTSEEENRGPARSCAATAAFDTYFLELSRTLDAGLRSRYPENLPLRVRFDAAGGIASVCAGDAAGGPPSGAYSRVSRSIPALRAVEGAPACLAGTSLDLTTGIETQRRRIHSSPAGLGPGPLASCTSIRNVICIDAYDPVCAVYPDGATRTYANACEACSDTFVKGYAPGPCRLN